MRTGGSIARFAEHLKQMILNDVADGAGLVVKAAAALHAEILRHGDLHAFDIGAIPERLHERIGEPEDEHVVHRPFAEVMVDAKIADSGKSPCRNRLRFCAEARSCAERLLDDDARAVPRRAATCRSCCTTVPNSDRRNRQIVGRTLGTCRAPSECA